MAKLYYQSLEGVGPWDSAPKQTGKFFGPYISYLKEAIGAAENQKLVMGWRPADAEEKKSFEKPRREAWEKKQRQARKWDAKKQNKQEFQSPKGKWIILQDPPWEKELPPPTLKAFLEAEEVYEDKRCSKEAKIKVLEVNQEGQALLLSNSPTPVEPDKDEENQPVTAANQHGNLLWLRVDTYPLKCQRNALHALERTPSKRLSPLVRLASSKAIWPEVEPELLAEKEWLILRPDTDEPLRDGTEEQRDFVEKALATPDFALLEGPPGSGKTTAICELVLQTLKQGERVLLVASTHVAVDNVVERLIDWDKNENKGPKLVLPVRIGDEYKVTSPTVEEYCLEKLEKTWRKKLMDFLGNPSSGTRLEGDEARKMLRTALLKDKKGENSEIIDFILTASNLVCGTTIGILQHPQIKKNNPSLQPFALMILDEASKTTFSEFVVPARHASKWVVVGDIKQLSPYVKIEDLEHNLKGLLNKDHARACMHAYLAEQDEPRKVRSLLATTEQTKDWIEKEANARTLCCVNLDTAQPQTWQDISGCIPELLTADIVYGSAQQLQHYQQHLPVDLLATGGTLPALPDWHAARHAYIAFTKAQNKKYKRGYPIEIHTDPSWAKEIAWRLGRSYELRQTMEGGKHYDDQIDALFPKGEDDENKNPHRPIENIRRAALPSILELLQWGFERHKGQRDGVVLTDGLPPDKLDERLVSLTYQHRMHPDISAFPREQFYQQEEEGENQQELLQDAAGMENRHQWGYTHYAKRAQWVSVPQPRRNSIQGNVNKDEAEQVIKELLKFAAWAQHNSPKEGTTHQAAVLTFYLGQEKELRTRLQKELGQRGHTRNFYFPKGTDSNTAKVHVTLCTVDGFQGHEADIVFLSFVKNGRHPGFLNSPNRLNVSLTRARYQLVLVGDQKSFKKGRTDLIKNLGNTKHYPADIPFKSDASS